MPRRCDVRHVEHDKTERAWKGWLNDLFEEAQ
ncbi:MAG: hypothetical protein JWP76_3042 [Dactylosporangium sp.]|jgi:sporulation-control protein spo0M|nr:hypothetical protein [Dactylosporangium sp.]